MSYTRWDIYAEEKKPNLDVKEHLAQMAQQLESKYLVMGSFGRKGEKEDPYRLGNTAYII